MNTKKSNQLNSALMSRRKALRLSAVALTRYVAPTVTTVSVAFAGPSRGEGGGVGPSSEGNNSSSGGNSQSGRDGGNDPEQNDDSGDNKDDRDLENRDTSSGSSLTSLNTPPSSASIYAGQSDDLQKIKRGNKIRKLSDVINTASTSYPGDIVSVKLKNSGDKIFYELKVLQNGNRLVKVKVDAQTLSIY